MAVGTLALVVVLALVLLSRQKSPATSPRSRLPDAILIPAGKYPTPDGTEEELQAFLIAPHEVTIGQYHDFIETLDTLAKDHRERTFDHENQPPGKTSHLPDDWTALYAAARANESWNGRPLTLDSPVVGVDWWDGAAYAEWKQVRLATQEEWFAALRKDVSSPASIKPSTWLPVTADSTDRTPQGLLGMAGSVCEWTRRPAVNPANPLGERKWVIIGGSFLKPGSNALTREWVDDRSLRRPDLGFRVVFDAK
jgi:formylglycine-generating enzyme required for sulfatase activity